MKARNYLFSLAAMLALAACSDSVTEEVTTTTDSDSTGNTYMAVTISFSSGTYTRADTRTAYETATENEANVTASNSIFLFYNDDGDYVTYGLMPSDTNFSDSSGTGVDKTATVVLAAYSGATPSQVLAVLNYEGIMSLTGKSADEVIATVTSTTPTSSSDSFTMANAVLVNTTSSSLSYLVSISETDLHDSESDAQSNPVKISVEREAVKAKITVQTTKTENDDTYKYILKDESNSTNPYYVTLGSDFTYWDKSGSTGTATFKVVLTGWAINAYNSSGYLVKNYDSEWDSSNSNYSTYSSDATSFYDSDTKSLFWAQDANYTYTSDSDEYTIGTYSEAGTSAGSGTGVYEGVNYLSYSQLTETSEEAAYYHENTADLSAQTAMQSGDDDIYACVPCVLVGGQIYVSTDGTNYDDTPETLYYNSGRFFTEGGLISAVCNELSSTYKWIETSGTETKELSNSYITNLSFTAASTTKNNKSIVTVSALTIAEGGAIYTTDSTKGSSTDTQKIDDTTWYKVADSSTTSSDALTALISAINKTTYLSTDDTDSSVGLACYTNGKCYYQAPIEQITGLSTSSSPSTLYGMVRNHSYVITLNSISWVGGPVYDETEELVLIPEEDGESYLGCEINILKWVSKEQEVNF